MTDDSARSPEVKPTHHKWITERARDALQEAVDRGEFDNLPGRGRPLDLTKDDNPFVPEDLKLSYRILSNAGFGVPWIEDRKDIDRLRKKLDRDVKQTEARLQALKSNLERAPVYLRASRIRKLQAEGAAAIDFLTKSVIVLNRRIDDYNLAVPSTSVQTNRVNLSEIIDRIAEPRLGGGQATRNS